MNALFTEKLYGLPGGQWRSLFNGANNQFNMLVDTGSSNEAVLGSCCQSISSKVFLCNHSPSCITSSTQVTVTYSSGNISGNLVQDTFLGKGMGQVNGVQFIQINSQNGFYQPGIDKYNGIIGLGYNALSQPANNPPRSLLDIVFSNTSVNKLFGMQLCGILQPLEYKNEITNYYSGEWVVGGVDSPTGRKFYSGSLLYTPIVEEKWYVVTISDIGYGGISLDLDCSVYNTPQTILDSGSTNLVLPSPVYALLFDKIRTATLNAIPSFPKYAFELDVKCCTPECNPSNQNSPLRYLPDIVISIALDNGHHSHDQFLVNIPPQYYWRPAVSNGTKCRTLGISEGKQLILGNVFMDGLYIVHDQGQKKVGIATAYNCPNGAISRKQVTASQKSIDWCSCLSPHQKISSLLVSYFPGASTCFFWQWWMYVFLISICLISAIGFYFFVTSCIQKQKRRKKREREGKKTDYENGFSRFSSFYQSDGSPILDGDEGYPEFSASHSSISYIENSENDIARLADLEDMPISPIRSPTDAMLSPNAVHSSHTIQSPNAIHLPDTSNVTILCSDIRGVSIQSLDSTNISPTAETDYNLSYDAQSSLQSATSWLSTPNEPGPISLACLATTLSESNSELNENERQGSLLDLM